MRNPTLRQKKTKVTPQKPLASAKITVGTQTSISTPPENHSLFTVTGTLHNTFSNEVKLEFRHGSIVSTNGFDLRDGRWNTRKNAPTLYGTVDNPSDYDHKKAKNLKEDESLVSFVLSGESEWLDKNKPNVTQTPIKNAKLTLLNLPPTNNVDTPPQDEDDHTKWFTKAIRGRWTVKDHYDPCINCASPWCTLKNDRAALTKLLKDISASKHTTAKEKRFLAYRQAAARRWGILGVGNRKRLGWCFETATRAAFPDPNYVGFKNSPTAAEDEEDDEDSVTTL